MRPRREPSIPGLLLFDEWITPEDETTLLDIIDNAPWSHVLRRRTQHYGYQYNYRARHIGPDDYLGPLPLWARALGEEFVRGGRAEEVTLPQPQQVIVNEYRTGQGIAAHVDAPVFGPIVATLSLAATWPMYFTRNHVFKDIVLPQRSLAVFTDEARTDWAHAIRPSASRLTRRVSVTFRTINGGH